MYISCKSDIVSDERVITYGRTFALPVSLDKPEFHLYLCMCMYGCVYAYMYVYLYVFIYVYVYT